MAIDTLNEWFNWAQASIMAPFTQQELAPKLAIPTPLKEAADAPALKGRVLEHSPEFNRFLHMLRFNLDAFLLHPGEFQTAPDTEKLALGKLHTIANNPSRPLATEVLPTTLEKIIDSYGVEKVMTALPSLPTTVTELKADDLYLRVKKDEANKLIKSITDDKTPVHEVYKMAYAWIQGNVSEIDCTLAHKAYLYGFINKTQLSQLCLILEAKMDPDHLSIEMDGKEALLKVLKENLKGEPGDRPELISQIKTGFEELTPLEQIYIRHKKAVDHCEGARAVVEDAEFTDFKTGDDLLVLSPAMLQVIYDSRFGDDAMQINPTFGHSNKIDHFKKIDSRDCFIPCSTFFHTPIVHSIPHSTPLFVYFHDAYHLTLEGINGREVRKLCLEMSEVFMDKSKGLRRFGIMLLDRESHFSLAKAQTVHPLFQGATKEECLWSGILMLFDNAKNSPFFTLPHNDKAIQRELLTWIESNPDKLPLQPLISLMNRRETLYNPENKDNLVVRSIIACERIPNRSHGTNLWLKKVKAVFCLSSTEHDEESVKKRTEIMQELKNCAEMDFKHIFDLAKALTEASLTS